jgi:energy-coupling factor transporter ATP-binding protein EcfA2
MNCRNCNTLLTTDAKFCAQCGTVAQPAGRQPGIPAGIKERAAGFTGRLWVLKAVRDWIDNGEERFFLITGDPGSGKTALAAWLAGAAGAAPADETLTRVNDSWKAMHFCVADDRRGSLNPGRFAQSLARQLADQYEEFAYAVLRANDPTIDIRLHAGENRGHMVGAQIGTLIINSNFEDIYNRAVREPLEELYNLSAGLSTLILVDALDEAFNFGPTNIVTLLAGSNDLPEGVRFLLTSRRDQDITGKFRSARRLDLSGDEHRGDTDGDIHDYVTRRLSELNGGRLVSPKAGVKSLEDELVQRAAGNFLYVKFLLDEVAQGKRALGEMESLPRGLYGLYRSYLDRVMPETSPQNSSMFWREQYQPLLGCLSVALPAAPRRNLHRWMGADDGQVNSLLSDVMQITEYDQEYGGAYRLYHRSMGDFLGVPEYRENGEVEVNKYYTPPGDQHERIVRYYTGQLPADWHSCDAYGLRQLVNHIHALWKLAETPPEKEGLAEVIFGVVLDDGFRQAQRDKLGGIYTTLGDLRTALDVALAHDNLIKALACVGAYRSIIRDRHLVQDMFAAVTNGDFERALRLAAYYSAVSSPKGTWARALHLYLAWEAAMAGNAESAVRAATAAQDLPEAQTSRLCDALLAHTAKVLAEKRAGDQQDALGWFDRLSPGRADAQRLLDTYKLAQPLTGTELQQFKAELEQSGEGSQKMEDQKAEIMASMAAELGAEKSAQHTWDFEGVAAAVMLPQVADTFALGAAVDGATTFLAFYVLGALAIPYPQYRDKALAALGTAILSAPDSSFVRSEIQRILNTTLDSEGVTFTFDLPCVLLTEAASRQMPAYLLSDYFDRAYNYDDVWGTKLRARSARAAALFRQGDNKGAFAELEEAERLTEGFSGYMTLHLLSLINRRIEFGLAGGQNVLLEETARRAETVSDQELREQRIKLVKDYSSWMTDNSEQLDLESVRSTLSTIRDPDARRAYKDFVAARWAGPTHEAKWKELKALIPMTLGDGTTLDAVLGRLFGLRIKRLSNEELDEAIYICAGNLTTGRPWRLWEGLEVKMQL